MAGDKPGPEPEVSDSSLLRLLALTYKPALSTSGIAEIVGLTRQAVDRRMWQLSESGCTDTAKLGSTRVWWLTDAGQRQVSRNELDKHDD